MGRAVSHGPGTTDESLVVVRVACPTCGGVEVTGGAVRVLVCSDTNDHSYAFQCPSCRVAVVKPAVTAVVDRLLSAGIRLLAWHVPADEAKAGPPICDADELSSRRHSPPVAHQVA